MPINSQMLVLVRALDRLRICAEPVCTANASALNLNLWRDSHERNQIHCMDGEWR